MLKRNYRLLGRIEGIFFRQAEKKSSRCWWQYFQADSGLDGPKIAIIAGKKQFQTSVKRHQAKRKMATLLEGQLASLAKGRYVYVLKTAILEDEGKRMRGEMGAKFGG
jgi:ribonuclease P protein component